MTKKKILKEGEPCRKCGHPVIKRLPLKKPRKTQKFYYRYYLYCPGCGVMYMINSEKVLVT